MKSNYNLHQPWETRIYRREVTSRCKKYRAPVLVGLRGMSDELVTDLFYFLPLNPIVIFKTEYSSDLIPVISFKLNISFKRFHKEFILQKLFQWKRPVINVRDEDIIFYFTNYRIAGSRLLQNPNWTLHPSTAQHRCYTS